VPIRLPTRPRFRLNSLDPTLAVGLVMALAGVLAPPAQAQKPQMGAPVEPQVGETLYLQLPLGSAEMPFTSERIKKVAPPTLTPEKSQVITLAQMERQAQDLELVFKFREAAEVWKAIFARVKESRAVLTDPAGVAGVAIHLGSAFAEAGEREAALQYFRIALALDGRVHPGAAYAPHVRELFDEARAIGPSLPPAPSAATMEALASLCGMEAILWLAVGQDTEGPVIVRRLFIAGRAQSEEVRRRLPTEEGARAEVYARESRAIEAIFLPPEEVSIKKTEPVEVIPPDPPVDWGAVALWTSVGLVSAAVVVGATGGTLAWVLGQDQVDVVVHQ
jgi:hypothetical protein